MTSYNRSIARRDKSWRTVLWYMDLKRTVWCAINESWKDVKRRAPSIIDAVDSTSYYRNCPLLWNDGRYAYYVHPLPTPRVFPFLFSFSRRCAVAPLQRTARTNFSITKVARIMALYLVVERCGLVRRILVVYRPSTNARCPHIRR